MIKEVVIVEGKSDVARVTAAVEAECIATEGYKIRRAVIDRIRIAYEKRGIIILTDPDMAGERIRRTLTKSFPEAKHAFVSREEATAEGDIGIERASVEAIRKALEMLHVERTETSGIFSERDMWAAELVGASESAARRGRIGAALGIGYANAKTFLYRMNHYGITRERFDEAVAYADERGETRGQSGNREVNQ